MHSIVIRGMIGVATILFLTMFSTPIHAQTQEQLGQAIQQAAVLNQQHNAESGQVQEVLGLAILDTAQNSLQSNSTEGPLQEQLGREIQDAAMFQYAQGLVQEKIGTTIVQMEMARS